MSRDETGRRARVQSADDRALRSPRARTPAPLALDAVDTLDESDASPAPEVHEEITGVQELLARLQRAELDPAARRVGEVVIQVLAEHQNRGERRAANRDMQIAARARADGARAETWLEKWGPTILGFLAGAVAAVAIWVNEVDDDRDALKLRMQYLEAADARTEQRLDELDHAVVELWKLRFFTPPAAPAFGGPP